MSSDKVNSKPTSIENPEEHLSDVFIDSFIEKNELLEDDDLISSSDDLDSLLESLIAESNGETPEIDFEERVIDSEVPPETATPTQTTPKPIVTKSSKDYSQTCNLQVKTNPSVFQKLKMSFGSKSPEDEAYEKSLEELIQKAEKYEAERIQAEKLEAEKLKEKMLQIEKAEKLEAAKAEAERVKAEKLEAERVEVERVEAERIKAEKLEAEQLEEERIKAEKLEAERVEAERVEAERVEAERVEAERVEAERVEAERVEAERVEAERVEAERIKTEKLEAQRIEAKLNEAKKKEAERVEAEKLEAERVEAEKLEAEKLKSKKITAAKAEVKRIEAKLSKAKAIAAEIVKVERLESVRLEAKKRKQEQQIEAEIKKRKLIQLEKLKQEKLMLENQQKKRLQMKLAAEKLANENLMKELEVEKSEFETLKASELEKELKKQRLEKEALIKEFKIAKYNKEKLALERLVNQNLDQEKLGGESPVSANNSIPVASEQIVLNSGIEENPSASKVDIDNTVEVVSVTKADNPNCDNSENDLTNPEQGQKNVIYCGKNEDISDLANLDRVSYIPEDFMSSSLIDNCEAAKRSAELVSLKVDGIIIIFDYSLNTVYCNVKLGSDEYRKICNKPNAHHQIEKSILRYEETRAHRTQRRKRQDLTHSFNTFIATSTLLTAQGRLLEGIDIKRKISIQDGIDENIFELIPYSDEILLEIRTHSMSLLDIARLTEIPQRYVFSFYNVALYLNLLNNATELELKENTGPSKNFLKGLFRK